MKASRRDLLISALSAGALVACGRPQRPPPPPPRPVRHLHVVAHPDDDILFMNPDLSVSIHNRQSTVAVFLTGGESNLPNPARYAADRQEGARASYARMADVPNEWVRRIVRFSGFREVEVDELRARPDVRLVFLNLPEDNNALTRHALIHVWESQSYAVDSLIPETGVVRRSYRYNRADIVSTLTSLFESFRPTTIRLQDAQPDLRYQANWVGFHNHPDHVIGARLAWEAAQRYLARPGREAVVLEYRDYNVADSPVNLSAADRLRKKEYFAAYSEHDPLAPLAGAYQAWTDRTYYRWPRVGSWAEIDGAGRLHAFSLQGTKLVHWLRTPNGTWLEPRTVSAPHQLRPSLSVIRTKGRLALVAQSLDGRRILLKRQLASGAWPPDWEPLDPPDGAQVGVPAAAFDVRGRLALAVQDGYGRVRIRREHTLGSWEGAWQELGGEHVQDGVALTLGPDGRLHAFASGRDRLLFWHEQRENSFTAHEFTTIRPAGPPRAAQVGGRVRVLARVAGDGAIAALTLPGRPEFLPNPGGLSPGVATDPDSVFVRNGVGGVSAAHGGGHWIDLGGQVLDHPAAVVEAKGTRTILAIGPSATLLTNRETPNAVALTFSGWREARPEPVPVASE